MFECRNVLAIQCSNTQYEQYALFCDDKGLYHGNDKDGFALLAVLDNIVQRYLLTTPNYFDSLKYKLSR